MLRVKLLLSIFLLLGLTACSNLQSTTQSRSSVPSDDPITTPILYAQHNFANDRGKFRGTNYGKGALVPVNTRAEIISTNENSRHGGKADIRLVDSGTVIAIEAVSPYSGLNIQRLLDRMFKPNPVVLSRFSTESIAAIKGGIVQAGMTQEEVLVARGYPPAHRTPSLESGIWVYWRNRFATDTIRFDAEGRVSAGRSDIAP